MAQDMLLFYGSGSIPCWKPMLVLEEKGLGDYEKKLISFSQKEHKGENIIKLNPRGQVPTFKDGSTVINESGAICDYLEYKYGNQGQRLLPEDAVQRAKVLQRTYESQNLFKALLEGVVYYYFRTKKEDVDEEHVKEKKKEATEELKRWEKYLEQDGPGSYMGGKDFSMADVYIFPILAFCVRSKLNLESYPNLKKYYEKVVQRPSVTASWPPHWKDSAPSDFFTSV